MQLARSRDCLQTPRGSHLVAELVLNCSACHTPSLPQGTPATWVCDPRLHPHPTLHPLWPLHSLPQFLHLMAGQLLWMQLQAPPLHGLLIISFLAELRQFEAPRAGDLHRCGTSPVSSRHSWSLRSLRPFVHLLNTLSPRRLNSLFMLKHLKQLPLSICPLHLPSLINLPWLAALQPCCLLALPQTSHSCPAPGHLLLWLPLNFLHSHSLYLSFGWDLGSNSRTLIGDPRHRKNSCLICSILKWEKSEASFGGLCGTRG